MISERSGEAMVTSPFSRCGRFERSFELGPEGWGWPAGGACAGIGEPLGRLPEARRAESALRLDCAASASGDFSLLDAQRADFRPLAHKETPEGGGPGAQLVTMNFDIKQLRAKGNSVTRDTHMKFLSENACEVWRRASTSRHPPETPE